MDELQRVMIGAAVAVGILPEPGLRTADKLRGLLDGAARSLTLVVIRCSGPHGVDQGLVHRGMKYLFAKAVELVVIWGRSKDGKVALTLDPKDLKYPGDILIDPGISKDIQKRIIDSAASAEQLFRAYQRYISREDRPAGEPVDRAAEVCAAFTWTARIALSWALTEELHDPESGGRIPV
ncbi:MAG TPA: hypothetical protein VIV61_17295 [Candidatus Ozemobacteraceae bacterium]